MTRTSLRVRRPPHPRISGTGGVDIVCQLLEAGALGETRTVQAKYGDYLIADHRIIGATWPVLGLPLVPWSPGLVPLVSRRTPRNDGGEPKLGTAAAGRCAGGAGEEAALTRGKRRAGCEGSLRDVTDAGGVERWAAALTGIAASIAAEDSPEAVAQAFAGGAVQQRKLSANDAITRARYFSRIGGASAP